MSIEKLGGTDRLTVTVDGGGTTTVAVAPILGSGGSGAASLPVGKPGQLVGYADDGSPVAVDPPRAAPALTGLRVVDGKLVADMSDGTSFQVALPAGPTAPTAIAPAITTRPSLSGSTALGGTITVRLGAATGTPDPVVTGSLKRAGRAAQAVVDGDTFVVDASDQGGTAVRTVTAANSAGTVSDTASLAIPAAVNTAPTLATIPALSATVGTPFTYTATASDAEGAVTWAWFGLPAGITANGATISGTPTAAGAVTITATVTDADGLTASRSATLTVAAAPVTTVAPTVTQQPTITGNATTGSVLTLNVGAASGDPAPTGTIQWMRDTTAISGATGTTYTLVVADEGKAITARVTWTNSAGSATGTSNAITGQAAPVTATAPAQVTGLTYAAPNLTWTVPADGGSPITRYDVEIVAAAASFTGTPTGTSTTTSLDVSAQPAGDWQARVRAVNVVGAGAWSNAAAFAVEATGPEMVEYFAATGATQPWMNGTTTPPAIRAGDVYLFAEETWHPEHGRRQESVTSYNRVTKRWTGPIGAISDTIFDDDHGTPSILVDHQGYYHIFGGPHNNYMRHSISRYPGSVSHWNKQTGANINGKYTYPHPILVGQSIYLFMRTQDSANNRYTLNLVKTTALNNGTVTWGTRTTVADFGADSRFYLGNVILRGTDLHMVASRADYVDNYRRDVFYLIYDTIAGGWRNYAGTHTTTGILDRATMEASYRLYAHDVAADRNGAIPQLEFDTAGRPHVVFQDGPLSGLQGGADGSGTDNDAYHILHDGTAWTAPFRFGMTTNRYDGMTIAPRPDGGMEAWWSEDVTNIRTRGGAIRRRIRSAAGVWSATETIRQDDATYPLGNPLAILNGDAEARVIFAELSLPQTEEAQLRTYAYGDSGYLKRPAVRPSILTRFDTQPATADAKLVTDLETALRDQGILQKMDLFYVLAGMDQQSSLLNWAQEGYDLVVNGAPTFTAKRGWKGASGAFLDTGYSDFNLTQMLPASVTLGVKATALVASYVPAISPRTASTPEVLIFPQHSNQGNQAVFQPYGKDPTQPLLILPDTTGLQHYTATQKDGARVGYVNGTQVVSDTTTVNTSKIAADLAVFRNNTNYNLSQIAVLYAGGYLTATEVGQLHTALDAYLKGIGVTT